MSRLHFHFITLFPETIDVWLKTSILGRAHEEKLFDFTLHQLRDFSKDKHRTVDDVAYGGGGGMVLRMEPLVSALEHIRTTIGSEKAMTIYFSPAGERLGQPLLTLLHEGDIQHFILVCGHYEAVDQRFIDRYVDLEVSLGDFVLTGGELPAVAFADALIRQTGKALGNEAGHLSESFRLQGPNSEMLLEYPHYTRPPDYHGMKVPDVLLSGNHQAIDEWRKHQAMDRTQKRRPDLLTTRNPKP